MGSISFPVSRGGDKGITAVGSTQLGAPVLENSVVVVSAVGADQAVQLPVATAGDPPLTVVAVGDASVLVFPAPGGSIQAAAIDAPFEVPLLVTATFLPVSETDDWAVSLSAATSAPPLVRTPEMEAEAAAKREAEKAKAEKDKDKADKAERKPKHEPRNHVAA